MLPELSKLIEVQELDKVIQEVVEELERLPGELKAEEAALEDQMAQQAAGLQELEDLQKQRRDTETEIAEMEDGITKSRGRLMEIKSNIEYKAMLKEISFKEDQRDQRETRMLQLMEQMESRKQALAELEAQIKERQAVLAQESAKVAAAVKKLEARRAGLDEQRKKMRKKVPAPLLKRYEFIRERRNGTAIAPVQEGVCFGCHMNILPQQFIDLQKGLEILQCPHCQRILYWQEEEAEGEAAQS
ncbi:MAG: C4-type zinc ribbon domain-containing protein [Deltaproteobacteria bacterium]|nr:C4-type zinc ribbon domain-containing protein [Deltaproteobacteria bacterium]